MCQFCWLSADAGFPELYSASAQAGKLATANDITLAALPKFESIVSDLEERTVFEETVAQALTPDCSGNADRGLPKTADLGFGRRIDFRLVLARMESGWEIPFGVGKSDATNVQILYELRGLGFSIHSNDL